MGRERTTMPTRGEPIKIRVTMTETGYPAPYEIVKDGHGSSVYPAPEEGWWWTFATPRAAKTLRRDGQKVVGTLTTTWIPPQTAGEVMPVDEPDGEFVMMYEPDGETPIGPRPALTPLASTGASD